MVNRKEDHDIINCNKNKNNHDETQKMSLKSCDCTIVFCEDVDQVAKLYI